MRPGKGGEGGQRPGGQPWLHWGPRLWGAVFAFGLATATMPSPAAARTQILHPLEGAVLQGSGGLVVGFCDDPERHEIVVTANGQSQTVALWEGVFEIDLDWQEGVNTVAAGGEQVTFTSDAYAESPREPSIHQASLDACGSCHVLGEERDLALKADGDDLCRGCHGNAVRDASHPGAECLSCHSPHTSWEPHLLRASGNGLCASCHEAEGVARRQGGHGAAASVDERGLQCAECHASHAPQPHDDRACARCHGDRRSGIAAHAEAACYTCHWMHRGGDLAAIKGPGRSCGVCHALPEAPLHADAVGECNQCHAIHDGGATREWGAASCGRCHPNIDAHPDYHGAEPLTDCRGCHSAHDPVDLSRAMARCAECHETAELAADHSGSTPAAGECGSCHRVHGASGERRVVQVQGGAAPLGSRSCQQCHGLAPFAGGTDLPGAWGELCLTCHRDLQPALTHGPARTLECEACHLAHGGDWQNRLRSGGDDGCLGCHPQLLRADSVRVATGLGRLSCLACHDPHGGTGPEHLRAERKNLCEGCHPDATRSPSGAAEMFVHGPVNTGDCALCHDPHEHGVPPAAARAVGELCRSCHDSIGAPQAGSTAHRPIAEGDCTACHDPHAAANPMLLKIDGNALCLGCHDTSGHPHKLQLLSASGYVTVPEEQLEGGGRLACLACHRPHGSEEPGLLADARATLCQTCH